MVASFNGPAGVAMDAAGAIALVVSGAWESGGDRALHPRSHQKPAGGMRDRESTLKLSVILAAMCAHRIDSDVAR